MLKNLALHFSNRARRRRALLFRELFHVDRDTRILDIGSEDGSNIHSVLKGLDHTPENVWIADVDASLVRNGRDAYGYSAVVIDEDAELPFADNAFDIVYCSSVLEHVTVSHERVWSATDGRKFRNEAWMHQKRFAREIMRIGKNYFVQTPAKSFPIESHTWLPFTGMLPRRLLLPLMKVSNKWWIKASQPDFNLLRAGELRELFPGGVVLRERLLGLTKSLMVIGKAGQAGKRSSGTF